MIALNLFLCIFTFFLALTMPVQAQENATSDSTQPTVNAEVPINPQNQKENNNQKNADQKKTFSFNIPDKRSLLFADLMFVSAGYPTSGNTRLALGSNLGKFIAVELSYMSGSQDVSLFGTSLGKIEQQIYGADIRIYPFKDSLNVIGFYGQRWLTATMKRDDGLNGTEVNIRQRVVGGGVGNRWHLGALHLGFDWLMYYSPVSKAKVSSKLAGRELSDADRDNLQDGIEKIERMPSVSFLNLSIGFGFI